MNKITFPQKRQMKGPEVAGLQDALLLLLDRGTLLANDETVRRQLAESLRKERSDQTYGEATYTLVRTFQAERNLQASGDVDEPTAKALNALLAEWAASDQPQRSFVVSGQVRRDDGQPLRGLAVRAEHMAPKGSFRLGEDSPDAEGRYTIRYEPLPGDNTLNLRLTVFDANGKALNSKDIQNVKPLQIVDLTIAGADVDIKTYRVEGKVFSGVSAGVGGLRVEIVDKGVGGKDVELAQTTTGQDGAYQSSFSDRKVRERGKAKPDAQARVYSGDTFLGASDVHYNASQRETLNVLLEDAAASGLQSEHEVLINALSSHVKDRLGKLEENDKQQDITYLANKTGWDARAVALAALADKFSDSTADASGARAIPQPLFYALFRAGLAANENTLYHTEAKTLENVWKKASDQGVIPKVSAEEIYRAVSRFQELSAQTMLTGPALSGVSNLKDMLAVSGIDDPQQKRFAELFATHRGDKQAFWKEVGAAFGPETANRLQVDGKLSFLTINNAPLMQKVHRSAGADRLTDPLQLAQAGYHRAESWMELLTADVEIPKDIPGDTADAKRGNYASYLAAQVRLSYPTAAVAYMVKARELPLSGAADGVITQVHEFLSQQQGNFEIGVHPVQQYIAQNKLQVADETINQVKRLQRVYQITASDQAMTGLMKRGIDAAYHVVRYDKDTFVRSFAEDLGGPEQAALTYDRSGQIHHAVLNIALNYLHARTAPAIGVHSPPSVVDPTPANASDVVAYATLESLFGSTDFCACEHCRSILSPAAYLVDLLLFLHSDEGQWSAFCETWRIKHGAPYPYPNGAKFEEAGRPPSTEISPFDVLNARRPDIQHLPLTCENTNTVLPYIDVVNETLEYFVANEINSLDKYQGHDTGDVESEDLLANPQFVLDASYTTLGETQFPAPLPFHQPLESLRRYFNKLEIPLPLAMERLLRKRDILAVDRTTDPPPPLSEYGWADILTEEVGISRSEYEILTDSNAVPLWRMYGFPNDEVDVIAALSNAKQFARRVGIKYEELISILKIRFVNPHSGLIPKLERLGVTFTTLKALKDGAITDAEFDALLPTGLSAPEPAAYGGDIKAWVKRDANYDRIMSLVTLTIPAVPWTPSKVYVARELVRPTAPESNSTLYFECTTAGTSAAAQPRWTTTPETTCNDGSVVWTCRNASNCASFDHLAFRYSDPARLSENIAAPEFVRLLRFIRLWKKLAWTVEQTDATICALFRSDLNPLDAPDINTLEELDSGFQTLIPRVGVVSLVIRELNLTVKRDLLPLLAGWSEIGTHGESALYRQMFLNPGLSQQDAVFADNGYGEFLNHVDVPYTHAQPTLEEPIVRASGGNISYSPSDQRLSFYGVLDQDTREALKRVDGISQLLKDAIDSLFQAQRLSAHQEALRSAFNLTGDEYSLITAELEFDSDTPLTMRTVSAVFRRGWLARKLKLSVRELLLLIRCTGLDPFAAPDPTNPAILRLISLVRALSDRSLKPTAALYLIWNQDLSGKSVPAFETIAALARALRLSFATVEREFAVTEDPQGVIAETRMAMVYGADTAATYFGLLNDTFTVEVVFNDTLGTMRPGAIREAIENAAGKTDASVPKLAYDDFRKRLAYSGVLTATVVNDVKTKAGALAAAFNEAVDALYSMNQGIVDPFFARYTELREPFDTYVTDVVHSVSEKRTALLQTILPDLVKRRKRQQAIQALTAAANVDLAFAQTLLDGPAAPFPLHSQGSADEPALIDLLALEKQGLAVQFFANDTATGATIDAPTIASNLDYGIGNPLPANPAEGATISGVWRGCLEAPETGFFKFHITVDATANVKLALDGSPVILAQNETDETLWTNTAPLQLRTGMLYPIEFTVEKVRDVLQLAWEWDPKGQGRSVIAGEYLFPAGVFDAFQEAHVRFLKATSLSAALRLSPNELAYFATHPDYLVAGDGWLNTLPASGIPADAIAIGLVKPFQALLDFARIKAEISPDDESLLAALKDPAAATKNADSLLFTISGWAQSSLYDVLAHFRDENRDAPPVTEAEARRLDIADLGRFDVFRRVFDAYVLIRKMGVSGKALIRGTTNEPTSETVRELQGALRARYDAASWRDVVRPINDEMRSLQRDALVAYILHQMGSNPDSAHIDTPDKLFEYFLMDVQMAPCIQTSRIRHALSSVQLFIERCLMNLEPRVSPAAIDAKQWQWMKRYRVWEANRKVYLFPENWLEPELRDDKSPFFKEIESELLQSDITDERASIALLNYLSKLEEVAKLEPCGIYHVPAEAGKSEIDHVIARTAGAHRKYYYRRSEGGSWTPWEHVKLDIEDNPVIPVVWQDRLFLFWLRILKQAPLDASSMSVSPGEVDDEGNEFELARTSVSAIRRSAQRDAALDTKLVVQAVLCWSEYFIGKWQATKTSDVNRPAELGSFPLSGEYAFDRSTVWLWKSESTDALCVSVVCPAGASAFLLYNTHSLPVKEEDGWRGLLSSVGTPQRLLHTSTDHLSISYSRHWSPFESPDITRLLLGKTMHGRTTSPSHPVQDAWNAPFFFEDSRHVFHVTTGEQSKWIEDGDYTFTLNPTPTTVEPGIPHLVMRAGPAAKPTRGGIAGLGVLDPGSVSASPIGSLISEDAYIHLGIDTTGAVPYGDTEFGLFGPIKIPPIVR